MTNFKNKVTVFIDSILTCVGITYGILNFEIVISSIVVFTIFLYFIYMSISAIVVSITNALLHERNKKIETENELLRKELELNNGGDKIANN